MQRQIKFRGLNIGGEWCFGSLSMPKNIINNVVPPGFYISNDYGMPFAYSVRPETVGQFIGLTDKNGKEIYESDIVKYKSLGEHTIGTVYWHDEGAIGWSIKNENHVDFLLSSVEYEILGNIHENKPEDFEG